MAGRWLFRPLPLQERVGRGVAPVSSTLRTRRLVVPSPPTPNPLPRGEREPEVPAAKSVFANSTVLRLKAEDSRFDADCLHRRSDTGSPSVSLVRVPLGQDPETFVSNVDSGGTIAIMHQSTAAHPMAIRERQFAVDRSTAATQAGRRKEVIDHDKVLAVPLALISPRLNRKLHLCRKSFA